MTLHLEGKTFGRLTAVSSLPASKDDSSKRWSCTCECGGQLIATARNLVNGRTRSCGCLRLETSAKNAIAHGAYKTPEYRAWSAAKSACNSPAHPRYPVTGARGITMSQEWQDSFSNFLTDMGKKPEPASQLLRLRKNQGFNKDNCVWYTVTSKTKGKASNENQPAS